MPSLPPSQYTNPKDRIGSMKVPLDLIPPVASAHAAMAHRDGAIKYGPYNWRVSGVRASVYIAACKRHLELWNSERQEVAADSKVHHLGHAIACLNIILDAQAAGKLVDDRPEVGAGLEHLLENLFRGIQGGVYRTPQTTPEPESNVTEPESNVTEPKPESGPSKEDPEWLKFIEPVLGSFPDGSFMPTAILARHIRGYFNSSELKLAPAVIVTALERVAFRGGDPWSWRVFRQTNSGNDGIRWRGGKAPDQHTPV